MHGKSTMHCVGPLNSRNGSGFKMDLKFGFIVPRKIYTREIRPSNCVLKTFSAFLLLRMRINTFDATSGFKMDLKFGFPVPKKHIHAGN